MRLDGSNLRVSVAMEFQLHLGARATQLWRVGRSDPWCVRLAVALFVANTLLLLWPVALVLLETRGLIPNIDRPWAHPGEDGSVAEFFNYGQVTLLVVFLFALFRHRGPVYLAWAFVYGFVLLDDSLEYHETVGAFIAANVNLPAVAGQGGQAVGEILAWALAGLVFLPIILRALLARGLPKMDGFLFLACFGTLIFFAVVIDLVHAMIGGRPLLLIEDGGEMMILAFTAVLALTLWRAHRLGHWDK